MSNVLERFRSVSEMDFYVIGQSILHETRAFLMNDDVIPKRERSIYTYPIIHLVQSMIDTFMAANKIYAYTMDDPRYKKRLKLEKHLAVIGDLLVDEEARLRGCKNKTRLLKRR